MKPWAQAALLLLISDVIWLALLIFAGVAFWPIDLRWGFEVPLFVVVGAPMNVIGYLLCWQAAREIKRVSR